MITRRTRRELTTASLAALLLLTPLAAASLERLEPIVDRRAYTALLDGLGIDGDEKMIAEMLYSDYAASLDDLAGRIDDAAEVAGRRRMQDALSGKIYVERDELRDLRVAVERTYQSAWVEADELLDDLRLNVRSLLDDSGDTPDGELAFAAFNRSVLLHPRQVAAQDEAYAGDGVDVIALVDEAAAPGGELEALDRAEVDPILDHYAGALDQLIVTTAAEDRRCRGARALARIRRDREAARREEGLSLDRWKRLYLLNRQVAEEIGAVTAERLGAEAERRWRERFDRACFPRLFEATRPDKEHAWIARSALNREILARASTIHGTFQAGIHRPANCTASC